MFQVFFIIFNFRAGLPVALRLRQSLTDFEKQQREAEAGPETGENPSTR